MRDIKSFAKEKKGEATSREPELREKVEELGSKSEAELMEELMRAAGDGKKNGSFSPEMLSQFMSSVSPMLNEEQKKRLTQLAGRLQ